jgi:hypothetical protein
MQQDSRPGLIDLDGAAAARREALGDAEIEVVFLGDSYRLPPELALATVEKAAGLLGLVDALSAAGDKGLDALPPDLAGQVKAILSDVMADLFGPEQWARFITGKPAIPQHRGRPSVQDMWVLFSSLLAAYGVSLGEALGPLVSLLSGGPRSKLTSSASTASTPDGSGPPTPSDASVSAG